MRPGRLAAACDPLMLRSKAAAAASEQDNAWKKIDQLLEHAQRAMPEFLDQT